MQLLHELLFRLIATEPVVFVCPLLITVAHLLVLLLIVGKEGMWQRS
jgi:hypothetical protein